MRNKVKDSYDVDESEEEWWDYYDEDRVVVCDLERYLR